MGPHTRSYRAAAIDSQNAGGKRATIISPCTSVIIRNMHPRWAVCVLLPALASCAAPKPAPTPAPEACLQTGTASWYRPAASGQGTASGTSPVSGALTAAHPTLPFGTQVLVTDVASGRSVVVRIADRGPSTKGHIIDISPAAATQLGMRQEGTAQVRLEIFHPPSETSGAKPAPLTDAACPFRQDTAA
jgi:rare lipoprotein A